MGVSSCEQRDESIAMNAAPWLKHLQLECLLLSRERPFWLVLLGLTLLCGAAVWDGIDQAQRQHQIALDLFSHQRTRVETDAIKARALDQGQQTLNPYFDPRLAGAYGTRYLAAPALLPQHIATVLEQGQRNVLSDYYQLQLDQRERYTSAHELVNPHRQLIGPIDLTFITLYLLPLAMIGLSYHIRTDDHAHGRLDLIATTHPYGIARVVRLRLLLRLAPPVVLVLASGIVACRLSPADYPADRGTTALAWAALLSVYSSVWALLITAMVRRSNQPAACFRALLASWLIIQIGLPAAVHVYSQRTALLPDRATSIRIMRDLNDRLHPHSHTAPPQDTQAKSDQVKTQTKQPSASPWTAARQYYRQRLSEQTQLDQWTWPLEQAFLRQQTSQARLIDQWAFVSPALMFQSQLQRLAGHDLGRHQRFFLRVEHWHDILRAYFRQRMAAESASQPSLDSYLANTRYPPFVSQTDPTPWFNRRDLCYWVFWLLSAIGAWIYGGRGRHSVL